MVLTANEKRVLRFLAAGYGKDYSINELAKACGITPNGAYKLLKKFDLEGILKMKSIANIKAYSLDFGSEKTELLLELSFMPSVLQGRMKERAADFRQLKDVVHACILFGSYITSKAEPGDLDVLFVIDKKDYGRYKKVLERVQGVVPAKIQDVVQTMIDLEQNTIRADPVVLAALRQGIVLWGCSTITKVMKNIYARQD